MNMEQWDHKDEWRKRGTDFLIVVTRHRVERIEPGSFVGELDKGPNRWAVYAYIYPKHPRFTTFDGSHRLMQPAAHKLPFHCGASLVEYHYDSLGALTSVQVGADYNHLHDQHFTLYDTPEEAVQVFEDALMLFNCLEGMAIKAKFE